MKCSQKPVLLVQLSMSAGTSILAEAGLTYLGVGVGAGVPSWGHSLATSVRFISIYPLTVLWPGLIVTMTVIALHLFGDALRDAIDPALPLGLGEVPYGPLQVMHLQADTSALQEDTGWRPATPFEEGIRETIEWVRKETK